MNVYDIQVEFICVNNDFFYRTDLNQGSLQAALAELSRNLKHIHITNYQVLGQRVSHFPDNHCDDISATFRISGLYQNQLEARNFRSALNKAADEIYAEMKATIAGNRRNEEVLAYQAFVVTVAENNRVMCSRTEMSKPMCARMAKMITKHLKASAKFEADFNKQQSRRARAAFRSLSPMDKRAVRQELDDH